MKNNVIINWNKKFKTDECPFDEFVGKKYFLIYRRSRTWKTFYLSFHQWSYKGAKHIISEDKDILKWACIEDWLGVAEDYPTKEELDEIYKEESEGYLSHCVELFNGR